MSKTQFGWNDESVAALKLLWDSGKSGSTCAKALVEKFGGVLSRSSISGACHRYGLAKRDKTSNHVADDKPKRRYRRRRADEQIARRLRFHATRNGGLYPEYVDAPGIVESFPQLNPDAIPLEQRKTFAQLDDHHCRFPYGDVGTPEFFYCGGDAIPSRAYCIYHCGIAYQRSYVSERDHERLQHLKAYRARLAEEKQRAAG